MWGNTISRRLPFRSTFEVVRLLNLLLGGVGGGGRVDGDVVIGAGLSFSLSKLLVSLGQEEKTIGGRRSNIGGLG